MPTIGVVLSGCGVYDGAEIHESVITLLALDRAEVDIVIMAPNAAQHHVIDHSIGEPVEGDSRNIYEESARIARGEIRDMAEVTAADFDAVIFPGGFGAAKNLCTFALHGPDCSVNPEVERIIKEAHAAGKPIGVECIAPAIVAKVLGGEGVTVTIGTDIDTAAGIEKTGAKHVNCAVDDVVVDEANKIVSTPAYMLASSIKEAAAGIEKLVAKIVDMA
jgi:enhancing lycopene biosynthesis protein 2